MASPDIVQPQGNGGTGGPNRRGDDEGNKRPASVKASLSVAFGQRAPNRSGAREDRFSSAMGANRGGAAGGGGSAQNRDKDKDRQPSKGRSR